MPRIVACFGIRQGAGATVRTVSLAWELAKTREVMLIDLDGSGGTVTEFLQMRDEDHGQRSISNCLGLPQIPVDALQEQAVRVLGRERLRVVPGVRTGCGPTMNEILPQIYKGLTELPDELVLVDLGTPLAYPGQRSIQSVGTILNQAFPGMEDKICYLWDDPFTLSSQIAQLRLANLNAAQVVITSRYKKLTSEARRVLEMETPDQVVKLAWPWAHDVSRQPFGAAAQAKVLGLSEGTTPERPTRRGLSLRRSPKST